MATHCIRYRRAWTAQSILALSALALLVPQSVVAQEKPRPTRAEGPAGVGDTSGTDNLNRRQAGAAAQQDNANIESAEAYRQRMDDYAAGQAAAAEARRLYEEEMAAYRTRQANYVAARQQWEADVRACNAGDRARCGTAAPTPQ